MLLYKHMRQKGKALKIILALLLPLIFFLVFYIDRIYPGVYVGNLYLGGKSPNEVVTYLKENSKPPTELNLISPNQTYKLTLADFNFSYDINSTASKAFNLGRSGNIMFDAGEIISSLISRKYYGLDLKLDETKLNQNLSIIAGQVTDDPIYPSVTLTNGKIVIQNGKPGTDLDIRNLRIQIGQKLSFSDNTPLTITPQVIDPSLSDDSINNIKARFGKLIGKSIKTNFNGQEVVISDSEIIPLLNLSGGYNEQNVVGLIDKLSKELERDPQNASFSFVDGRVKEFAPERDGIKIKRDELKTSIINALIQLERGDNKETTFDIPAITTKAKIKTSDVNNLGIKELIGVGTSRFAGSIASRVHNVNLAATRLNGVLVEPGQTFSFDDAVGDISVYSGYQQAYIISGGKTILGDGGGVCQVSTTIFRAAMNAGLPIIERNAHAYRVHYYEEDALPGLDATVYSPTVDFKFKNDAPGSILIQTHIDLSNLVLTFEFYGTADGRVATVTKPILSNYVPAPAPLYTEDPTLPRGVVKQIDFSAPGTNSKFDYTVTRNGETIFEKTFYSNFRPWQAKFLVGTRV